MDWNFVTCMGKSRLIKCFKMILLQDKNIFKFLAVNANPTPLDWAITVSLIKFSCPWQKTFYAGIVSLDQSFAKWDQ